MVSGFNSQAVTHLTLYAYCRVAEALKERSLVFKIPSVGGLPISGQTDYG